MTEQNPEAPEGQLPAPPTEPTTEPTTTGTDPVRVVVVGTEQPATDSMSADERAASVAAPPLVDAPADADEATSKGWAVFDRTLGQYRPGIATTKPSASDARKAVPEGHTAAVVRV